MRAISKTVKGMGILLCLGFFALTNTAKAELLVNGSYTVEFKYSTKKECEEAGEEYKWDERIVNGKDKGNCVKLSPNTTVLTNAMVVKEIDTKKVDVSKNEKKRDSNLKDLQKDFDALGFECAEAKEAISNYKAKANEYIAAAKVSNDLTDKVLNSCNKYSQIKSEYKLCLRGDKGVETIKTQKAQDETIHQELYMNEALSDAKAAIKSCKATNKDDKNAGKAADKAEGKAEDALKTAVKKTGCSEDEIKNDTCVAKLQAAYEACTDAKDCKNKKSALDDADKYQKKYNEAVGKANDARKAADNAEQSKLDAQCSGELKWNKEKGMCAIPNASDEDWKECGGQAYHYNGTCYLTASEKNAAQKADNEKALSDAQSAYDACVKEKGEEACAAEKEKLNAAASSLGGEVEPYSDDDLNNLKQEALDAERGVKRCKDTSVTGEVRGTFGIFDYLACKITTVVADIRVLVYILSGFGIIAFAYSAILGKLNWKQFSNIAIGLFILSMTTSIIEYVAYDGDSGSLPYGMWLPNGNHASLGNGETIGCDDNHPEACPDAAIDSMKDSTSSWSFKDLKSTIQSAKSAVTTAAGIYSTVKNTVDTVSKAVKNVTDAIGGTNDYVRTAEANLKEARAQENEAQAAYNKEVEAYNEVLDEYNSVKAQYDAAQDKVDQTQAEIDHYNKLLNIDAIESQADAADKKVADLEAQLAGLDESRPAQKAQADALRAQIEQAKQEAQAKRAEANSLRDEAEGMLSNNVKNKRTELSNLEKSAENANKQVSDIQNKINDFINANPYSEEHKMAQDKVNQTQAEIDHYNKLLNVDNIGRQAEAADKKVADLEAKLAGLDESRPAEKADADALRAQIQEAKQDAANKNAEYKALSQEASNMSSDDIKNKINTLNKDLRDDKFMLSQTEQKMGDKLKELQSELSNAQTDARQKNQEVKDTKNEVDKMIRGEINAKINNLKDDLADNKYLLSQQKTGMDEATKKLKEAGNKLSDAEAELLGKKAVTAQAESNLDYAKSTVDKDLISRMGTVATNVNTAMKSVTYASGAVAMGASSVLNDVRDARSSSSEKEYRAAAQAAYDELKSKCDKGRCNSAELASLENLKGQVDDNTLGIDKWLNDDGKGGGATILAGIEKTAKTVSQAEDTTRKIAASKRDGENAGQAFGSDTLGDILGGAFAATELYTSGGDFINNMDTDYRSAEKKRSDNAAADLAAKQSTCAGLGGTYDGSKCVKNGKTVDMKTGAETRTTTDANGNNVSTTTLKTDDGTQVTTQTTTTADGQTSTVTVTKNADGSTVTTVTEGGKTTTLRKDSDGTQTVNNNPSKAEQECREAKGGRWDPEKKECIDASRVSQNELDCKQEGGTWNGKQCNNPKRKDCESKDGTWVADGAKSHCIELSKEEQCRRKTDGSVWDAKENKCLSKKEQCEKAGMEWTKEGDCKLPQAFIDKGKEIAEEKAQEMLEKVGVQDTTAPKGSGVGTRTYPCPEGQVPMHDDFGNQIGCKTKTTIPEANALLNQGTAKDILRNLPNIGKK